MVVRAGKYVQAVRGSTQAVVGTGSVWENVQAVRGSTVVHVRTGSVWEYVQAVCGRTYRQCMGVRTGSTGGVWKYVWEHIQAVHRRTYRQ